MFNRLHLASANYHITSFDVSIYLLTAWLYIFTFCKNVVICFPITYSQSLWESVS